MEDHELRSKDTARYRRTNAGLVARKLTTYDHQRVDAVIGLDRIVGVLLDVVPRRRNQFLQDAGVGRCGVGGHLAREHLQHPEGVGEEPAGGCGVSPGRDQYVDDLPVLVDGAGRHSARPR